MKHEQTPQGVILAGFRLFSKNVNTHFFVSVIMSIVQLKTTKLPSQNYELPCNLKDFDDVSDAEIREYLLSIPACLIFTNTEVRQLIDMRPTENNQQLFNACFEKLGKLTFGKWIALIEKHNKSLN